MALHQQNKFKFKPQIIADSARAYRQKTHRVAGAIHRGLPPPIQTGGGGLSDAETARHNRRGPECARAPSASSVFEADARPRAARARIASAGGDPETPAGPWLPGDGRGRPPAAVAQPGPWPERHQRSATAPGHVQRNRRRDPALVQLADLVCATVFRLLRGFDVYRVGAPVAALFVTFGAPCRPVRGATLRSNVLLLRCYALSVIERAHLAVPIVLIALLYMRRLVERNPRLALQVGAEFRVFTVALVLAHKNFNDQRVPNAAFAQVSGLPLRELNVMEVEFMVMIHHRMVVSAATYDSWSTALQHVSDAIWALKVARGSVGLALLAERLSDSPR